MGHGVRSCLLAPKFSCCHNNSKKRKGEEEKGVRRRCWSCEALPVFRLVRGNTLKLNSFSVNVLSLASALASPDPTSTNGDDGPVTGPMVVKTNTGCEDEYCCCPCHEKKDNTPPATPPPLPSYLTPPPSGYYMPSQHSDGSMMSGFYRYYSYN
jgi:hypothetical protein